MKKVYPKVKKIINKSIDEAKSRNDDKVRIEHIMIAMINDNDNEAVKYLKDLDVDLDNLYKMIDLQMEKNEEPVKVKHLPLSDNTEKILQKYSPAQGPENRWGDASSSCCRSSPGRPTRSDRRARTHPLPT